MNKERIYQLLREFYYEKNTLEDTIEFLSFMTCQLIKIQEEGDKK